jgi:hypothetical protein
MTDSHEAAKLMASIIYADLDIKVGPTELAVMIRQRWARLAPLAHAVHDAPDETKSGAPVQPGMEQAAKPLSAKKRAAAELRNIIAGMEMNGMGMQASSLRSVIAILEPTP